MTTRLELAQGLSSTALEAIAALEQRVLEHDGGRLKLEWSTLRARSGERVEDVLAWDDERLVGFVGIYAFGSKTAELAGMVDPAARRRGIATALLTAALPSCAGYTQRLLVTPRDSRAGAAFAAEHGAALEHSEHALVLRGEPAPGASGPALHLRDATGADLPELQRLLGEAFGFGTELVAARLVMEGARTLVVEHGGTTVGTVRVTRDGDVGGVYGFAIDAAMRGRGLGREVLRRVCRTLRAEGAQRVGLEVAVENEHALGLYTSVGFERATTEDYYALPQ